MAGLITGFSTKIDYNKNCKFLRESQKNVALNCGTINHFLAGAIVMKDK
jgi:hypothetical protein